jgi:hypothetical protein
MKLNNIELGKIEAAKTAYIPKLARELFKITITNRGNIRIKIR